MIRFWKVETGAMVFGMDDGVRLGMGEDVVSGVGGDDVEDVFRVAVGVTVVCEGKSLWISTLGVILCAGCVSSDFSGIQGIMVLRPKATIASSSRFRNSINTTPPGVSRKLHPERRRRGRGGGVSAE